jgi:Beta-lactamase enzyme family
VLAVALAVVVGASLQARYDVAREVVESSRDARAVAAAKREIAAVEHADGAPRDRTYRSPPLPDGWARAHPERRRDAVLSARLRAIASQFDGTTAVWVHDLATGRVASWNAEAAIPAASPVKLATFAAALRERRRNLRYDVVQVAAWSSNLAANRIVEILGYARVYSAMRALGMSHSTYPGPYRAGTAVVAAHSRVTTAHDLGRALFALQRAALGRSAFLPRSQGQRALALLRASIPYGANTGLVRPWVGRAPVAQKNGWLEDVRVTAAIVYRKRGPVIVVVALHRDDLHPSTARELGRRVWRAVVRA